MSAGPDIANRIRHALGDLSDPPIITDAEIADALADYPNWRLAAASIAESLAARAVNRPQSFTAVGDMSISWGDRARSWLAIAARLRQEAAAENAGAGRIVTEQLYRDDGTFMAPEYSIRRPSKRMRR